MSAISLNTLQSCGDGLLDEGLSTMAAASWHAHKLRCTRNLCANEAQPRHVMQSKSRSCQPLT